jgi:hypothetical protein
VPVLQTFSKRLLNDTQTPCGAALSRADSVLAAQRLIKDVRHAVFRYVCRRVSVVDIKLHTLIVFIKLK